jgi:hypothetical protein
VELTLKTSRAWERLLPQHHVAPSKVDVKPDAKFQETPHEATPYGVDMLHRLRFRGQSYDAQGDAGTVSTKTIHVRSPLDYDGLVEVFEITAGSKAERHT